MGREEELKEEIRELEEKLKDREEALPAHSVRPHQIMLIEELEEAIEQKKGKLSELKKEKQSDERDA